MTLVWPTPLYRTLSPALSVWSRATITVLVLWICHNVDSALSQWSYQYVVLYVKPATWNLSYLRTSAPCIKSSWLWSTWIVVMYSYLAMPSLVCHWLPPYLLLHPPLTTFMSSFVHMSQLAPLSVLRAPLLTSVCSLVDLCVLPCRPLCAPLSTSVCSHVNLCALPCWPLRAPLSTSVYSLVDLCVLPCHPVSMFGRASSWTLDVETTAVFLIYRQTMTSKMCRHDRVSCVCVCVL